MKIYLMSAEKLHKPAGSIFAPIAANQAEPQQYEHYAKVV